MNGSNDNTATNYQHAARMAFDSHGSQCSAVVYALLAIADKLALVDDRLDDLARSNFRIAESLASSVPWPVRIEP